MFKRLHHAARIVLRDKLLDGFTRVVQPDVMAGELLGFLVVRDELEEHTLAAGVRP